MATRQEQDKRKIKDKEDRTCQGGRPTIQSVLIHCIEYYGMAFLVLILGFLPGFLFLDSLSDRFSLEERLCMSFGFTILLIGIGYLVTYLSGMAINNAFPKIVFCLFVFLVVYRLTKGMKTKKEAGSQSISFIVAILLVQYLLKISIQPMIPFYPVGIDYHEHYQRAIFFFEIHESNPFEPIAWCEWYPSDRTPLFNIVGAFFFSLTYEKFWILQVVSCLFNSILILPSYLIADKVFDRKTALITALLISMNPYLTENALYTWPKNLAAYFCLLLIYFGVFRREMICAGLFAGLGYLSHQYSLLYIIATIAYLVMRGRTQTGIPFKKLMNMLLFLGLTVFPWFAWKTLVYRSPFRGPFLYYPFSVHGALWVINASPDEIFSEFWATPATKIMWTRIVNAAETLLPLTLTSHPITKSNISHYYFHTIPGALTLAPLIFMFKGLRENRTELRAMYPFLVIPFLGTLYLFGWPHGAGLARQTLQPVVAILIVFAASALSKTKRATFVFSYLVETVEFCVFIWWLHIYELYELQKSYTPEFIPKRMLVWDLVGPNQLLFVLPTVFLQLFLIGLAVYADRRRLRMKAQHQYSVSES